MTKRQARAPAPSGWQPRGSGYQWRTPTGERYAIQPTPRAATYVVKHWLASLQVEVPVAHAVHGLNEAKKVAKAHYQDVQRAMGGAP